MLPVTVQAPDDVEARIVELVAHGYRDIDARRIAVGEQLTNATHALGLDACACGLIAITYLRCAKLRYQAPCCPAHRDGALAWFKAENLRDHEWRAEAMNVTFWSSFKEARLGRDGEQAHADPFRRESYRGKLDRCANCGAPRFADECGEFIEPESEQARAAS